MSEPRLTEQEEHLLSEVMSGDRPDDDGAVTEAAAGNPAFAAALRELQTLRHDLADDGEREQAQLAAALQSESEVPEQIVEVTIRRLARPLGTPATRRAPRWIAWVSCAAAAVLLLVWSLGGLGGGDTDDDHRHLGDGDAFVFWRTPVEGGGLRLTWTSPDRAAMFRVWVLDPDRGDKRILVDDLEGTATEWTIPPEMLAELPKNARWRVTAIVGGRDVEASERPR